MRTLRRVEPALWALSILGGGVASWIVPALYASVAIALPLGWLGAPDDGFLRLRGLLGSAPAAVAIGGALGLVFWHAAHRLRVLASELGLARLDAPIAWILYGLAIAGTYWSLDAALSIRV